VLSHGSQTHIPNDQLVFDADATSSYHPAGNFLFGDGSVHVISNGINGRVYEALLTRAGNEPIQGMRFKPIESMRERKARPLAFATRRRGSF